VFGFRWQDGGEIGLGKGLGEAAGQREKLHGAAFATREQEDFTAFLAVTPIPGAKARVV